MKKLILLFGFALGYVAGAAAGRERYEQIRDLTMKAKNDPRVQEGASKAAESAREAAPVVKDKVSGAADTVQQKAKGDAKREDSAYPKG